jgi:hypothetical protein
MLAASHKGVERSLREVASASSWAGPSPGRQPVVLPWCVPDCGGSAPPRRSDGAGEPRRTSRLLSGTRVGQLPVVTVTGAAPTRLRCRFGSPAVLGGQQPPAASGSRRGSPEAAGAAQDCRTEDRPAAGVSHRTGDHKLARNTMISTSATISSSISAFSVAHGQPPFTSELGHDAKTPPEAQTARELYLGEPGRADPAGGVRASAGRFGGHRPGLRVTRELGCGDPL